MVHRCQAVGPRELAEVFTFPFEAAIRQARLACIMPGYQELDGIPMHGHHQLLTTTLRHRWGFRGLVVSDYFAVRFLAVPGAPQSSEPPVAADARDTGVVAQGSGTGSGGTGGDVGGEDDDAGITLHEPLHHMAASLDSAAQLALTSGVDLELPTTECYTPSAVATMPAPAVSAAVARVVDMKRRVCAGSSACEGVADAVQAAAAVRTEAQLVAAKRIACKGSVLLVNRGGVLPLTSQGRGRLAVLGPSADSVRKLLGDYTHASQHGLSMGGADMSLVPSTTKVGPRVGLLM